MFLQPQHFQQMERSLLNTLVAQLKTSGRPFYGLTELSIDQDALVNGQCTIIRCSGIFPDGTIFSVPGDEAALPSRSFAKAMAHDQQACDVFLALPRQILGKVNVAAGGTDANDIRYQGRQEQVTDDVLGNQKKEIEVGLLNLTILFSGESPDNFSTIKIGRLVRDAGGQVALDDKFIPALLSVSASPRLLNVLRGLLEVLLAKSGALSQGRRQVEGGLAEFGGTEETAFRLLQVINTYAPLLNYYHFSPVGTHPFDLFTVLTQLTGALCTFTNDISLKNLPRYEHGNLTAMFETFDRLVRAVLQADIAAGCVAIPLQQINPATYVAPVGDERLFSAAQFYLGIAAKAAEKELIVGVLQRVKMCSRERLDLLISSAMPGLQLIHVSRPPQTLSTKPGFVYFALDKSGDLWQGMIVAKNIAFYFPNNYADLRIELLALKQ